MKIEKDVHITIPEEIRTYLRKLTITPEEWINKECKKYKGYKLRPIPNYKRVDIHIILQPHTLEALQKIKVEGYSNKIIHLYYDMKRRQEKEERRRKIYNTLFKK